MNCILPLSLCASKVVMLPLHNNAFMVLTNSIDLFSVFVNSIKTFVRLVQNDANAQGSKFSTKPVCLVTFFRELPPQQFEKKRYRLLSVAHMFIFAEDHIIVEETTPDQVQRFDSYVPYGI